MTDKQIEEVHAENNYNRDVEVVTLRKGDIVARQQHKHGTDYQGGKDHPNGQFFSEPGASKDQLGLKGDYNQTPRKVDYYVVEKDTRVLKTTAHDVEWNQNTPGKGTGELHYGGETQYYAAEKDLKNFNRIASEKRAEEAGSSRQLERKEREEPGKQDRKNELDPAQRKREEQARQDQMAAYDEARKQQRIRDEHARRAESSRKQEQIQNKAERKQFDQSKSAGPQKQR